MLRAIFLPMGKSCPPFAIFMTDHGENKNATT